MKDIYKKNSKLHIPISTDLKTKLEKQAFEAGLSLSDYVRLILSKVKIKEVVVE